MQPNPLVLSGTHLGCDRPLQDRTTGLDAAKCVNNNRPPQGCDRQRQAGNPRCFSSRNDPRIRRFLLCHNSSTLTWAFTMHPKLLDPDRHPLGPADQPYSDNPPVGNADVLRRIT